MAKKGFDMMALMNDASKKNAAGAARYELQNIPLEKMTPNPANAKIYETGEIDELAQSILLAGKVLQNAVVTAADKKGNYTIIAGHRRRLACQKLVEEGHKEFAEMPCMVMTEPDGLMQELILIQTNSTARVLSEAEKMRQAERATAILTELKSKKQISGRVRDIVAKMLNTTTGQLGRYNVISKGLTNETLRAAFEQGKMGISAAYEAARLDEKGQAELAEKMAAGGESAPSARDAVEQRKKDEIARAADEAKSGLSMRKLWVADIKKKYKAKLTVKYEERDGKFYAGISYDTKSISYTTPIDSKTPYETAQEAIEGGIKRAAKDNRAMHEALWGSGYSIVGEPKEEPPKEKAEWLNIRGNGKTTLVAKIITAKKDGEYITKVEYGRYGENCPVTSIGAYPNMKSARAAAIEHMERYAPIYIVKGLLDAGLIEKMPERFAEVETPEPEETAEEMPEAEDEAQTAEPESEEKKYNHKEECGIRISAIREIIDNLKTRRGYEEQEAAICKEEGEERKEAIARAAMDFYDEMIDYAEQEIDNIADSM